MLFLLIFSLFFFFWYLIKDSSEYLDSILKSRNITLPVKVHLVKAIVFPLVMYGCESWTRKKAEPYAALAARQDSLSITKSQSLLKLMSIEAVKPSKHLVLCCPLLLLPSIFPSIRVFSNEWALHIRWPKYWSLTFSITHSNEYSQLISFRIDWFDLLAVQGTVKRLLQHHSLKASILWHSAFSVVQLSHPYMTIGKTIALTIWTFVNKVMSLLFNTLSGLCRGGRNELGRVDRVQGGK